MNFLAEKEFEHGPSLSYEAGKDDRGKEPVDDGRLPLNERVVSKNQSQPTKDDNDAEGGQVGRLETAIS